MLLVGGAVLRTRALPLSLGYLAAAIGMIGIVSVVPVLRDAGMIFGLLQIVWFAWTGIAMLRTSQREVERVVSSPGVAAA